MNDFKEWLSDYLRYFLLGFAILAVIVIAICGIKVYQKIANPGPKTQSTESVKVETESTDTEDENSTEKNTDRQTEKSTEKLSEKSTDSEGQKEKESEPSKETEDGQTESSSKSETESEENTGETSAPEETGKDPEYLKVATSRLNFRSEPDGQVLNSYGSGRIVKFLGKEGDWYKVRVGGRDGYMSAQYLEEVPYEAGMEAEVETEPQTEAPVKAEPIYKTLKQACYLRAETSKESQILATYEAGATIQFLEDVGGWYRVQVDGMIGYMGAQFF